VRQFRDVSPTEAWLHLDADTTKNMEARVVPLGPWCVRLIEMLRKLVKDKQPDDLIFTRGLNHRAVQRFDKLWKRGCGMAGVNEGLLVHDLRRTAAQRMLDAGIAVPRIMQICGWKTMSTFLRYAMTGRNVLRPELEKLVEFERKQRQGRQELVQQMEMENGGQMRASAGKDRLDLSHSRRKSMHSVASSSSRASRGRLLKKGKIARNE
jgi:hypothetical protein